MNTEDFRRHAHDFVDWMADYLEGIEAYPVRARVGPGEIAARLPAAPPAEGEPMERIFADFKALILPGITHWQHPSFFAYFTANSSPPSVLAEMLTATLAVQGMSWQTSPAATELETLTMDWLRQLLGLPEGFAGVIHDTASVATLSALLTARDRALDWTSMDRGLAGGGSLITYASAEAHSSVDKAVRIAGLGEDNLRKIPTTKSGGLEPGELSREIEADLAAGRKPVCVVATLGSTGRSGFDPLRPIGESCRAHGIWLHVDAAWAGSALVLPEERWMIEGIEYADSFVVNPHKWLFTNFDCTAFFVRDPGALTRSFAIQPEYLKTREGEAVINYRDWGIQLGRRFRALKLWFVIRSYGAAGLRQKVAAHIAWARELAEQVEAAEDFELLAPARLAMLCFRYRPSGVARPDLLDALNQRLLETLNDGGKLYLSHTRIDGAYAIRFNIGQTWTERRHVMEAWTRIRETARDLGGEAA